MWIAPLSWAELRAVDRWSHGLWCLAAFGLPLGTAPAVLFSGLAVLVSAWSWVSAKTHSPDLWQDWWQAWRASPASLRALVWGCLILFVWLSLSAWWSIAPTSDLQESWSRYRRLLYVPFALWGLWLGLRAGGSGRDWLFWFALGASLSAVVSWLAYWGWTGAWFGSGAGQAGAWVWAGQKIVSFPAASNPAFGHSHIAAGAFLVIAANAWLMLTRVSWPGLAAAAFTATPVLLMQGRTGYVLLLVSTVAWFGLGLVCVWRLWRGGRGAKVGTDTGTGAGTGTGPGAVAMRGLAGLLVVLTWLQTSPHLQWRSQQAAAEVQGYVQTQPTTPVTSQGIRLAFWQAGLEMTTASASRLVFGLGVGGYAQGYRALRGQPTPEGSGQPHSEYMALLVQAGLVGLGLWLWIWVSALRLAWWSVNALIPLRQSHRSPHLTRFGLLLMLGLLLLDAGFNSVLWNVEEGHLLVLVWAGLAAWCLAYGRPAPDHAKRGLIQAC